MSKTNWIVIIGIVLLVIIGVWAYFGSGGDDGAAAIEPAVDAPADGTADPAADGTAEPAAN